MSPPWSARGKSSAMNYTVRALGLRFDGVCIPKMFSPFRVAPPSSGRGQEGVMSDYFGNRTSSFGEAADSVSAAASSVTASMHTAGDAASKAASGAVNRARAITERASIESIKDTQSKLHTQNQLILGLPRKDRAAHLQQVCLDQE